MIYAKLHSFTSNTGPQTCIASRFDQPDQSWLAYDVPDPSWLSVVGGVIVAATSATVIQKVPSSVTMRQAQEALLDDGTLDLVESTIAAMTGIAGKRARIQWTKSGSVQRNWPLVLQLGPVIGKTPEQLDQLFIAADKL